MKEGGPAKPRPKEPSNTDKFLKSLEKFKKHKKSGSHSRDRAHYEVDESSPEGDMLQLIRNDELSQNTSPPASLSRANGPRRDLFDDL